MEGGGLNPSPTLGGLHATTAAINNGQVVGCARPAAAAIPFSTLGNGGGRALMAVTGSLPGRSHAHEAVAAEQNVTALAELEVGDATCSLDRNPCPHAPATGGVLIPTLHRTARP